jgi:hypothetical protein
MCLLFAVLPFLPTDAMEFSPASRSCRTSRSFSLRAEAAGHPEGTTLITTHHRRKVMKSILGLILLLCVATIDLSAQFSDEFNEDVLDDRWTWIRESPSSWLLANDALTIWTEKGALNGTRFNDVRNMLLQPLSGSLPEKYTIETHVLFSPYWTLQNTGLLYYVDEDNYIRVSRGINDGRNTIWLEWEIDGETHFRYADASFTLEGLYSQAPTTLRLTCMNGTEFSASYKLEHEEGWVAFASEMIALPSEGRHIGVQASNGAGMMATDTPRRAIFEYFRYHIGLSVPAPSDTPVSFSIEAAYPAPVAAGSDVSLLVYIDRGTRLQWRLSDILGREVLPPRSLGYRPSGRHLVTFSTETLSPGVYLWQIDAGATQATRRILLTR